MSIATEITRLQNAKSSIKTAIEGKGVTVPSTTKLDGYGELISSIPSGGDDFWQQAVDAINAHTFQMEVVDPMVETHWGIGTVDYSIVDGVGSDDSISVDGNIVTQDTERLAGEFRPKSTGAANIKRIIQLPTLVIHYGNPLFQGFANLERIEQPIHNTSTYGFCFQNSPKIEYVKFYGAANYVVSLERAFDNCTALVSLDLSGLHGFYNYYFAFNGCNSLKNLDLSNVNNARTTRMTSMFAGCTALETLKLGEGFFKSTSVTSIAINNSPNWTHDSMIESLYTNQLNRDTTNAKTVTLHATAKARLSDTEKANIAALGITIA